MLQLFLQLAPERLKKIESAVAHADASALQQEAGLIGAAADQLAMPSLGVCARRIEQAAARGDLGQMKQDLEALRREFQSLEALTI